MQLTHCEFSLESTLQIRLELFDDRRRLAALDRVLKEQKKHKEQRESKEGASRPVPGVSGRRTAA